jgi:magnesium transporter
MKMCVAEQTDPYMSLVDASLYQSGPVDFGSAGQHLCTAVPRVGLHTQVKDVLPLLRRGRFDSVAEIAVCDERGKLHGLINIEDLFAASDNLTAEELMDPAPPVVAPGVHQEIAAWTAVRRRESSLAVVDEQGTFLGLIPPDRIIAVLLHEHAEDLSRFGGVLHDVESAREASGEPILRRLWHRLPWLVLGLAAAIGSARMMEGFEGTLRAQFALAFFLPGVVYLADAVGTQTETLVVRGLSVGVPIRGVAAREAFTGVLAGSIMALLFYPAAILIWGDVRVAAAVAIALFSACSVATIVAMALPWLLHRLGFDPAFGSGPLATVVQDLLSIAIYLVAATALFT